MLNFDVGNNIFYCELCRHMQNGNHTKKCGRCMEIYRGAPTQYEPKPIEEMENKR